MDAPARPFTSSSEPLFTGVPAAVEYVAELLAEAPGLLTEAVNRALDEEVEALREKFAYTRYAPLGSSFDIKADGNDLLYGFSAVHGVRNPSTGRFMSWKTVEYGEEGEPATGFLRSAVVNRSHKVGQRVTQLISEVL